MRQWVTGKGGRAATPFYSCGVAGDYQSRGVEINSDAVEIQCTDYARGNDRTTPL
jgi:hypothetical protein